MLKQVAKVGGGLSSIVAYTPFKQLGVLFADSLIEFFVRANDRIEYDNGRIKYEYDSDKTQLSFEDAVFGIGKALGTTIVIAGGLILFSIVLLNGALSPLDVVTSTPIMVISMIFSLFTFIATGDRLSEIDLEIVQSEES